MLEKFTRQLVILAGKKEKELERRENQEKRLRKLADRAYKTNLEQWEALTACIKHQQERRINLIYDILTIQKVLAGMGKNSKGECYDRYA